MKHIKKTTFLVNNKVIGFADKAKREYIMQFLDPLPKP